MSIIVSNGIWIVGVPTSLARCFIGLGKFIIFSIVLHILISDIYRFTIPEIRRLVPLLRLREVKWSHRVCPSEEMAFCVVLARLAYPNR